jgi:ankyrin repeat protein
MESDPLNSELDESVSRARELLYLLSQGETHEHILEFLRDNPALPLWVQEEETGWTVLHYAAAREDSLMVERFLQAGANWNLCMSAFLLSHRLHQVGI